MLRTVLTFLLLLFVVTVVAADDSQPIPWRDPMVQSDQYAQYQLTDTQVVSEEQISSFLADGQKQPLRTFDEEVDPVVQVGLTLEEKEYLRKKPSEALLRSAVLPGWGQRYGERNFRGAIFSGVEVGLWTMLLLSRQSWLEGEDDYMTFARQHAGISGNQDHQYYVDIGNYNTMDQFNEAQRQQRQYADQYRSSSYYWEWDSKQNRERFEDIRIEADQAKRRIYYFVGGMVLNRIAASIDATRGLSKRQKQLRTKEASFSFHLGIDPKTNGPSLVWTW